MFRLRNTIYLTVASCSLALAAYQSNSAVDPTSSMASNAGNFGDLIAKATDATADMTGQPLIVASTRH